MDRSRFIQTSPSYYTLAIALFFLDNDSASKNKIIGEYRYRDEFDEKSIFRLRDNGLLQISLKRLIDYGLIETIEDDFGPQIIVKSPDFDRAWEVLAKSEPGSFGNYIRLGKEGFVWLLSALDRLNELYDEFGIVDEDYSDPDREWTPLPLDRQSSELLDAISRIDQTIDQVEGDNGYAAHLPEERAYVLDTLKQTSSKLKRTLTPP